MSPHNEDLCIEEIKGRIQRTLAGMKDLRSRLNAMEALTDAPPAGNLPQGSGVEAVEKGDGELLVKAVALPLRLNSALKERIVSWGLRHKEKIKRVPLANDFLKRLYHRLRST